MALAADLIATTDTRVIVGLGATGLSCARHLHAANVQFSVVDSRTEPPGLAELRAQIPDVRVYTGKYPDNVITDASEVIASPGVAMNSPVLRLAQDAGVAVVGDVDLFMREANAPVVGITGSNAKSTVTELLGQMARDAGLNVGVGGNLGPPALELLDEGRALYVLELSSFQLERAGALDLSVATILNVTPDHLDRHGTMQAYHQAKHRIFRGCKAAVVNRDDRLTIPLLPDDIPVVSWRMREPELDGFGLREIDGTEHLCRGFDSILPADELGMPGRHNIANALAALALGQTVGLDDAVMAQTLRAFGGLPHRCEAIGQWQGVRFVNDSKGTNVGATRAALSGLAEGRNIVLIAGGQAKGADLAELRAVVQQCCKALVLIGEDAPLFADALADSVPTVRAESMEDAVSAAAAQADSGDIVLLSPACASFDMFSGYEARGDSFRTALTRLRGAA